MMDMEEAKAVAAGSNLSVDEVLARAREEVHLRKVQNPMRKIWERDYESLIKRAQELIFRQDALFWKQSHLAAQRLSNHSKLAAKRRILVSKLLYSWFADHVADTSGSTA